MALPPAGTAVGTAVLFKASQSPLPALLRWGKEQREAFYFPPEGNFFCPPHTPGLSVRAAAPLFHRPSLAGVTVGTEPPLLRQSPSFPVPTHSRTPPSDVPMCGPSRSACVLSWGSFEF